MMAGLHHIKGALPFTLVHNDFHTMNILRRRAWGGDEELVVVDFQVLGLVRVAR